MMGGFRRFLWRGRGCGGAFFVWDKVCVFVVFCLVFSTRLLFLAFFGKMSRMFLEIIFLYDLEKYIEIGLYGFFSFLFAYEYGF